MPLTWLQKIKISNNNTIVDSNLSVRNVRKWGTGIYLVDVVGDGLLVLNQGFDQGWVAFTPDLGFKIYDLRFLKHVKVNGWGNGWIVPVNSEQRTVDGADLPAGEAGHRLLTTVVLLYWPQILEWIGLGMLVGGVGGVIVYTRFK